MEHFCPRKGGRIYDQMRKLGASLDWSREHFTMDEVRTLRSDYTNLFKLACEASYLKLLLITHNCSFLMEFI